jgi:ABC-2 type transport system permease protein
MEIKPINPRIINGINVVGLKTLIYKEISRFFNVYMQTLCAPVLTTVLFYTVFLLAFGGEDRMVDDIHFMQFLAPGLIIMSMVQNAFANTSSSLVIAKIQGNIVDVLMAPLSPAELLAGYIIGAVYRGLLIGGISIIVLFFMGAILVHNVALIFLFAVLGNLLMAGLGVLGGLWSDKFDQLAAFTNFIITPLTFLSGTFYSIKILPHFWQVLALGNPFFYMIDGFRYGFTGHADGNVLVGILYLFILNAIVLTWAWWMIRTGYKIKS